jgi:hypothetical protein
MGIHQIPVTKAGKRTIAVDTAESLMPAEVYDAVVFEGLRHFINLGTSRLKQEDYATLEAFEAAAWEIAEKQVAKLYSGDIRKRQTATKTKGAGVEMTEALRLAKLSAKEQYKVLAATDKSLPRMSHIPAKQWTESAKAMVNADPDTWLATARESLNRSRETPKANAEIFAHLTADPKKVAASKAKGKGKEKPAAPVVKAKKGKGAGATA